MDAVKPAEKTREINDVLQNPELTVKEREQYVNTLTEEEMRSVFLQMCSIYASKGEWWMKFRIEYDLPPTRGIFTTTISASSESEARELFKVAHPRGKIRKVIAQ